MQACVCLMGVIVCVGVRGGNRKQSVWLASKYGWYRILQKERPPKEVSGPDWWLQQSLCPPLHHFNLHIGMTLTRFSSPTDWLTWWRDSSSTTGAASWTISRKMLCFYFCTPRFLIWYFVVSAVFFILLATYVGLYSSSDSFRLPSAFSGSKVGYTHSNLQIWGTSTVSCRRILWHLRMEKTELNR